MFEGGGAIVKTTLKEVNSAIGALDSNTVNRFDQLVKKVRYQERYEAWVRIKRQLPIVL